MRNTVRALFVIAVLLSAAAAPVMLAGLDLNGLNGGVEPEPPLQEGRDLYFDATERFFNESASLGTIRRQLDRAYQILAGVRSDRLRLYWQARASYITGFVEREDGREEEAEKRFLLSHSLATTALAQGEFSEGYRLQADNYAQLMSYNGLFYRLKYGRQIIELCKRSIELDSGNVKAHLTLAISYMFAPPIAGGSLSRSIEILHSLRGVEEMERLDRFAINAWLGVAYSRRDDLERARRYFRIALNVFPGNSWMRDQLREIRTVSSR